MEPMGNAPPQPQQKKKKLRISVVAGAVVSVVAVTSGVIAIVNYFQNRDQHNVPSYTGELTTLPAAQDFEDFLKQNDQHIVHLDIECGETDVNDNITKGQVGPNDRCFFLGNTDTSSGPQEDVGTCVLTAGRYTAYQYWGLPADTPGQNDGVTWFKLETPSSGSDSTVSNGPKGAGWVVVKGYYSESRTELGNAPPGTDQYILRAVNISDANK